MGKDKLRRFAENETFACLVQPEFDQIFHKDHPLKGRWREDFCHNDRPRCLELGCGRGEYTVALGQRNPEVNYLGVDIKGARMWRGAKTATEYGLSNVGFLRTRIEFIESFFADGEVDEIWITFPDPQLKKGREKKRLTSPLFLARYARMLAPGGVIHLKTDSQPLHEYTRAVVSANGLPQEECNADIYGTGLADETLSVKTAYESRFLAEGLSITYIRFRLDGKHSFIPPETD
jgi:tRNA (guanine-N7-)-methyltransferase